MSKMVSHCSFGHLKHKLWAKEGPGVELSGVCQFWLPTTNSRESTRNTKLQTTCDIPLESSWRGLQLCFRPCCDRSSAQEVMRPQSPGSLGWRDFGTPTRESRGSPGSLGSEKPFGCGLPGESQSILYGGWWWHPPSPGRGESCVSKCPWLVPTPKGVPNAKLTTLWFVLDADSHKLS
jgi:hypothetical protein